MTAEERFERIEHVAAGIVEQARRDREESRELWRETQRHLARLTIDIDRLSLQVSQLAGTVDNLAATMASDAASLREEMRQLGKESDARIAGLVSAIGTYLTKRE